MTSARTATPRPAQGARRLQVLIVDDHRLFGEVLALRLSSERSVSGVDRADSVQAAVALLATAQPDAVLLDYDLGTECGLDLFAHLDGLARRPAVLMLAGDLDVDHIVQALRAGASGWVDKGSDIRMLTAALGRAVAGDLVLPEPSVAAVIRGLLVEPPPAPGEELLAALSPRRRDVLGCLLDGLDPAETAARLHVSRNTVRSHIQALFHQFDVHSTSALLAHVRDAGVTGLSDGATAPGRTCPAP